MSQYKIHSEVFGPYDNFSHILEECATKKAIVIDPAWDANYLQNRLNNLGLTLSAIWLTHGHHDHVSAIDDLRALQDHEVPVYASKTEIDFIRSYAPNELPKAFLPIPDDTIAFHDNDVLHHGEVPVKVIATPGHSSGSVCFLLKDDMLTGDTLFIDGCGRADLDGSDPQALLHSLNRLIEEVPHHVELHTGHAYGPTPTATLASQIKTNRYLQLAQASAADFIKFRNRT